MAKHQSGARKRKKPAAKKSKKTGAKKGRKRGPKKGSKHTQAHNDAIAAGIAPKIFRLRPQMVKPCVSC